MFNQHYRFQKDIFLFIFVRTTKPKNYDSSEKIIRYSVLSIGEIS
jgi:hypothetical protein